MATRDFDEYKVVKENDKEAVLRVMLSTFDPKNPKHTTKVDVTDGESGQKNLKVGADLDGKLYSLEVPGVDVDPTTKVAPSKGKFEVTMKKKSKFSLAEKIST